MYSDFYFFSKFKNSNIKINVPKHIILHSFPHIANDCFDHYKIKNSQRILNVSQLLKSKCPNTYNDKFWMPILVKDANFGQLFKTI